MLLFEDSFKVCDIPHHKVLWVEFHLQVTDLIMQMRSVTQSGVTRQGNKFAFFNAVADLDLEAV